MKPTSSRSSAPITKELIESLRPDSLLFIEFCDDMKSVHIRKAHDYGSNTDPLGNFESARRLGLDPVKGIFLRMQDKMSRIEAFCQKGELKNESLDDALLDLANYSQLARVALRRSSDGPR